MARKLPSIPSIDSRIPDEIRRILSPMKQIMDQALESGRSGTPGPFGGTSAEDILAVLPDAITDSSIPPAPTGFTVTGAFATIMLAWNKPTYRNHAYIEIWRNEVDSLTGAVLIGQTPGTQYSDAVGNSMSAYYWIRCVSQAGVAGSYNSVSGTHGVTSLDPTYTLSVLQDAITTSQLHQDLGGRIDLIDASASVQGSVAQRLALEAAARANDVSQLATRIDTLVAQAGGNTEDIIAAITQEQTARTAADNALASSISAVATTSNSNTSAITAEQTARANADSALSTRIDSVVASAGSNAAAITAEQTARANADNSLSTRIDAVVATNNANAAAITAEQTARASADSANASSIQTLQSTVSGHTTSIQELFSTTDGLGAAYTFKVDNNGYVSGYGFASIANTGNPVATFAVRSDSFYIASPSGPGIAPTMPFYVQTTPTTINGVYVPVGAYMTDAYIANGSITTAKIGLAAIDTAQIAEAAIVDAHIAYLSADKITAGFIAAERIAAKSITADKIAGGQIAATEQITVGGAGSNAPLVLTGSGEVISNGTSGDKARLYSGNVEIYKNVPDVGQVLYKALSRIEMGVATNNTRVTVPGYFKTQPKVMVSPRNLCMFKSAYAGQDQTVQCSANSIAETSSGSMVWQFTPVATLSLAAAGGTSVLNQASGSVSSNTWTSNQFVTAANTSTITLSFSAGSNRGNGSSQYFYRSVRWRVEYLNGSNWIAGDWVVSDIGASTSNIVTGNQTVNFPSAGAWTCRIYAECYDTNGSVFGSVAYEYTTQNASRSDTKTVQSYYGSINTQTLDYQPSYSVPSGWELTNVAFTHTYDWWVSSSLGASAYVSGGGIYKAGTSSGSGTTTWNNTTNLLRFTAHSAWSSPYGSEGRLTLHSCSAVYSLRRVIQNSTTPANTFQINSYSYALSSAQVLSEGSLNWVAMGD